MPSPLDTPHPDEEQEPTWKLLVTGSLVLPQPQLWLWRSCFSQAAWGCETQGCGCLGLRAPAAWHYLVQSGCSGWEWPALCGPSMSGGMGQKGEARGKLFPSQSSRHYKGNLFQGKNTWTPRSQPLQLLAFLWPHLWSDPHQWRAQHPWSRRWHLRRQGLRDQGPSFHPPPGSQPSPCQKADQGPHLYLPGRLRVAGTLGGWWNSSRN